MKYSKTFSFPCSVFHYTCTPCFGIYYYYSCYCLFLLLLNAVKVIIKLEQAKRNDVKVLPMHATPEMKRFTGSFLPYHYGIHFANKARTSSWRVLCNQCRGHKSIPYGPSSLSSSVSPSASLSSSQTIPCGSVEPTSGPSSSTPPTPTCVPRMAKERDQQGHSVASFPVSFNGAERKRRDKWAERGVACSAIRFPQEEKEMMENYLKQLRYYSFGVQSSGVQLVYSQKVLQEQITAVEAIPWWSYPVKMTVSSPSFSSKDSTPISSADPLSTATTPTVTIAVHLPTWKETWAWWGRWARWVAQVEYEERETTKSTVLSSFFPRDKEILSSTVPRSSYSFDRTEKRYGSRSEATTVAGMIWWWWWWWWVWGYLVPVILATIFSVEVFIPAQVALELHHELHLRALNLKLFEDSK